MRSVIVLQIKSCPSRPSRQTSLPPPAHKNRYRHLRAAFELSLQTGATQRRGSTNVCVHKLTQRVCVHGRMDGMCTPQRSEVPQQQYKPLTWHAGRHGKEQAHGSALWVFADRSARTSPGDTRLSATLSDLRMVWKASEVASKKAHLQNDKLGVCWPHGNTGASCVEMRRVPVSLLGLICPTNA